jgi:hypothetical protein
MRDCRLWNAAPPRLQQSRRRSDSSSATQCESAASQPQDGAAKPYAIRAMHYTMQKRAIVVLPYRIDQASSSIQSAWHIGQGRTGTVQSLIRPASTEQANTVNGDWLEHNKVNSKRSRRHTTINVDTKIGYGVQHSTTAYAPTVGDAAGIWC